MNRVIILDTDIGTNPDDFFSLLILLNLENIDLKMIVTGNKYPVERARFVKEILRNSGRTDIKVFAGEEKGCVEFFAQKYIGKSDELIPNDYLDGIKKIIDEYGRVTYINIQGCSNLARFIKKYPTYNDKLIVYHMGMTTKLADNDYIKGGTNMEADQIAAKNVYEAELDMKVVGSHTTINDALRVNPETALYKKLQSSKEINHKILLEHLADYHQRRNMWPALHDPLTVATALGEKFVDFEEINVSFNKDGLYKTGSGGTKVIISKIDSKAGEFMRFCEKNI